MKTVVLRCHPATKAGDITSDSRSPSRVALPRQMGRAPTHRGCRQRQSPLVEPGAGPPPAGPVLPPSPARQRCGYRPTGGASANQPPRPGPPARRTPGQMDGQAQHLQPLPLAAPVAGGGRAEQQDKTCVLTMQSTALCQSTIHMLSGSSTGLAVKLGSPIQSGA